MVIKRLIVTDLKKLIAMAKVMATMTPIKKVTDLAIRKAIMMVKVTLINLAIVTH